jgi:hypothetical protein
MSKQPCSICNKPKAPNECALCHISVCKTCVHFLSPNDFLFLTHIPSKLTHQVYCLSCYNSDIEKPLAEYNEKIEQAKNVMIFTKSQAKETRFIKRLEDPLVITECPDKDEVLLRMAFKAVNLNYNSIIDVELKPLKVRDGSYHTHIWSGTGIPANVEEDKLMKDRSFKSMPN